MSQKINWIDNLRGIACLMVVVIHTTTWYLTNPQVVSTFSWELSNVLNAASRVSVPLFFMISGYLFFGERSAQKRHFLRIATCILFYSVVSLLYILFFTKANWHLALLNLLQKPVFYHLWFFFAIVVIYLLSPLIQVKNVTLQTVLALALFFGVIANPNTVPQTFHNITWLPVNLYIRGDTFYYILYGLLGRALGVMETGKPLFTWSAVGIFAVCVLSIVLGTRRELAWRGNFGDTYYIYCGPLVFIAALSLFVVIKNIFSQHRNHVLAFISSHSLGIYGFHALIIHILRSRNITLTHWPVLDLLWVSSAALGGSLLLSALLQRLDSRRLMS